MDFEWDETKAAANYVKHKVDFKNASRVFVDPYRLEIDDDSDYGEPRLNVIGMVDGQMLHVTYTTTDDGCRIISARRAEPHEKRQYHEV